jgi:hypothetical protein
MTAPARIRRSADWRRGQTTPLSADLPTRLSFKHDCAQKTVRLDINEAQNTLSITTGRFASRAFALSLVRCAAVSATRRGMIFSVFLNTWAKWLPDVRHSLAICEIDGSSARLASTALEDPAGLPRSQAALRSNSGQAGDSTARIMSSTVVGPDVAFQKATYREPRTPAFAAVLSLRCHWGPA